MTTQYVVALAFSSPSRARYRYQTRRHVHDCPATPLSPSRAHQPYPLPAGLWFNSYFFASSSVSATAGRRCPRNIELSLMPQYVCGPLLGQRLGEPLRSLRLHLALLFTAARQLLRATSVGRAPYLHTACFVNLFISSPHLVFT